MSLFTRRLPWPATVIMSTCLVGLGAGLAVLPGPSRLVWAGAYAVSGVLLFVWRTTGRSVPLVLSMGLLFSLSFTRAVLHVLVHPDSVHLAKISTHVLIATFAALVLRAESHPEGNGS